MIGVIICGHGEFAKGVNSAVTLISGSHENVVAINYTQGMSPDGLRLMMSEVLERFKGKAVFFTDIAGGTPYIQASLLSLEYPEVRVVSGTNVASVLEVVFLGTSHVDSFAESAVSAGKSSLGMFKNEERDSGSDDNFESGI